MTAPTFYFNLTQMPTKEKHWEIYAIIFLIALLFAVAIPKFRYTLEKAREAQVVSNMHLLKAKLEEFASQTHGKYPIDLKTRTDEINPEAAEKFSVLEKLDSVMNPYSKELGDGKAIVQLPPGSEPPDSAMEGVVLYIPLNPVDTVKGTPWCSDYLIKGYGKNGRVLPCTLRADTLLHR